ncbi:hypothetical protein ACEWY4_006056 [Coilia grayii]|uniref:Transmembrane protein 200C n=1 Tax=Coilia grayii TaxID=363190 RepID=A0ABD1KCM2_9TELE
MIATGGLLRISRRQDSLRSKTRAESQRQQRRRARRKRKSDVVVVKGKLQVCSLSGLVAAVGVLVLLVGIAMAVLGYWPKDQPELSEAWAANSLQANREPQRSGSAPLMAWNHTSNTKTGKQQELNSTQGNATTLELSSAPAPAPSLGILGELLSSCLHSDQLKMLGPLVMGMGIFLFICANAVLHEDRDRQTKVIDLRDIYSTVIDAHSLRSKEHPSPINGLVNYSQAHSGAEVGVLDAGARPHGSWPSTLWVFGSAGGGGSRRPSCARRCSWWHDGGEAGWGDAAYSASRERERRSSARSWETGSIVTSSLNAFTLPVIKLNNREMEEGVGAEEEQVEEEEDYGRREVQRGEEWGVEEQEWNVASKDRPSFPVAIETKAEVSRADVSDSQSSLGTKRWGQRSSPRWSLSEGASGRKVVGSLLSLNSLSDVAGVRRAAGGRHDDHSRRFSCPRLERSGSKGYIKLADLGGESFEGPDGGIPSRGAEEHSGRLMVAAASSAPAVEVLVETGTISRAERQGTMSEHTLAEDIVIKHTLVEHTPVHTQPPVPHPHVVITCSPSRFSSAGDDQ